MQLDIDRLEPSSSNKNSYVLLLREVEGDRKLPIVIGPCNAGSIAIYLESDRNPERPLTHDIIKSITNNFNITVPLRFGKNIVNRTLNNSTDIGTLVL